VYAELREKRGAISNILRVHSLNLEVLEPRLGNIAIHAEKLTSAPSAMTESDLDPLRAEGLSDQDILDITLIVAYFSFVNRIALGLGVSYSAEELAGYRDD
jgi:uncharacterized peroxidase-related enzyme